MPRYFFDIHRDDELAADAVGTDLANSSAACRQARGLPPFPKRDGPAPGELRSFRVVVRCQDGERRDRGSMVYAGMWLQPSDALDLS